MKRVLDSPPNGPPRLLRRGYKYHHGYTERVQRRASLTWKPAKPPAQTGPWSWKPIHQPEREQLDEHGTDLCDDQARTGCVLEYADVAAGRRAKRRARARLAMMVGAWSVGAVAAVDVCGRRRASIAEAVAGWRRSVTAFSSTLSSSSQPLLPSAHYVPGPGRHSNPAEGEAAPGLPSVLNHPDSYRLQETRVP